MGRNLTLAAALAAAAVFPSQDPKQDEPFQTLQQVFRANLQACLKEDLEAMMKTIHKDSPVAEATRATMGSLMEQYDLDYKLVSCSYIGGDGEYAVIRAKQETRKTKGPEFRDNAVDAMHVFKKDGGEWKIWQTAVLEVKFLD